MSKISDLKKKLELVKKEIEAKGKDALKEAFGEFFDANPKVKGIRWQQYTPYFSDGDVCEFGVRGAYVKIDGDEVPEDEAEYDDDYQYISTYNKTGDVHEVMKATDDFWSEVSDNEDIFEAAFGDHVQVTATRRGFKVEEYEHE